MKPTVKNVIARLNSRELRGEVEVDFLKLGEEGYSMVFEAVWSEAGLDRRQVANGLMALFAGRTLGDPDQLFSLALRKLEHAEVGVRSSAARIVVALLFMRGHVPTLSVDERTEAKSRLRLSQQVGLDDKADAMVTAFFDGTLAW